MAALGIAGTADARKGRRVPAHSARADSNPMVRIRGVSGNAELTPLQFAQWLQLQPPGLLEATGIASLHRVSMRTQLLNRTSDEFREADTDGNGRVSAREIATFLASRAARISHA
ncbi:EF-hand domain-containing protein [Sphingomonas montanisoli]|nr:EF-hand domain-containing protein [Sphingomonas montanisoli]